MFKSIEATGKTIDLAIQAGLEKLQMDRDSVSVEVLVQPRSGFFGIGATPAKVKLTYEIPDPEPVKPAPVQPAPVKAEKPVKPEQPGKAEKAEPSVKAERSEKAERTVRPERPAQTQKPAPQKPAAPRKEAVREAAPRKEDQRVHGEPVTITGEPQPAPAGSIEERIETFLKGLMEHMGSDAVPVVTKVNDDTYAVELQGASLGMLIGRHGDTLDAIQHLTNYTVNHGQNKRVRINVDAENYRKKREESLEHLATKIAGKVVRTHRNVTLEPMNAYERHVIHAALQDYPDVTTYSTGTEPNRRIVVAYSRYRSVEPEEN